MARRARRSPFEVKLGAQAFTDLEHRLSREIQDALDARVKIVGDDMEIDRRHTLYEGGSKRLAKAWPWEGAANLTSYLGTEKVDAWRARVMQTIFTEPVWIVEGWGEAAARAALVEEFHQWKVEEERLQTTLGRVMHNAFVEGTGVLEVLERPQPRKVTRTAHFAPMQMPDGSILHDPETAEPVPKLGPDNRPIEVPAGAPGAIAKVVEEVVNVAAGPQYYVHSLKDFVILPGHARDVKEVWGYAARSWCRKPELEAREKAGLYNGVDRLSAAGDRPVRPEDTRAGQDIQTPQAPREEFAIWKLVFLDDLEDLGVESWYVATLSVDDRVILRVQKMAVGQPSFLLFSPFIRSSSLYGYSAIEKLQTLIDEHTAIRNQVSDRSTMVNAAPIKRVVGSLWDPQEQPWGPMQIIDVRDPDEVQPVQIPDVPGSVIQRESAVLAAAERVSGLNDATLGVNPQQDRTLGEFNTVVAQSMVRVEESIRYLQEPLEHLFVLRHELWKRALEAGPQRLPPSVIAVLEGRGAQVPNEEVDATMLAGVFRGKPRASVEGADPNRMRNDFVGFLNSMANLATAVPMLLQALNSPQAVMSILEQGMRVFGWKDRRALTALIQAPQNGLGMVPNLLPPAPPNGAPGGVQAPTGALPPMPPTMQ